MRRLETLLASENVGRLVTNGTFLILGSCEFKQGLSPPNTALLSLLETAMNISPQASNSDFQDDRISWMSRSNAASLYRRSVAPADFAYFPEASFADCLPPALALQNRKRKI